MKRIVLLTCGLLSLASVAMASTYKIAAVSYKDGDKDWTDEVTVNGAVSENDNTYVVKIGDFNDKYIVTKVLSDESTNQQMEAMDSKGTTCILQILVEGDKLYFNIIYTNFIILCRIETNS